MALAVSYLRVSTKEQAEKGGTEEGYSIPAQREANRRKASELGAVIVQEFVDAGESARKADRPQLNHLLAYIAEHRVAYCIVHKVDRLARNRVDDVTIHLALKQAGVVLVSASENIDETPSGMLLHGIMSTIAEFYSRNLASEVIKGMTQKVKAGGTPGQAPLGYRNTRHRDEQGREVRTVIVDPDRAPLVRWAFVAYASGNWTLSQLHDELAARGLTTVPTPKRPAHPISLSGLHNILGNPYYRGEITYRGATYRGVHELFVPPEVWYQVQNVLAAHNSAGDRTQAHDHYLKGAVYCGQCGSLLVISHARSASGPIYPYFICAGRHRKRTDCTRPAMLVDTVERLVIDYYTRLELPADVVLRLRATLTHHFDGLIASAQQELQELTDRRRRLEAEQDQLLDAHLAGAVPVAVLQRHQGRIEAELAAITQRLQDQYGDYEATRNCLSQALDLLSNAHKLYLAGDDQTRRLCNQAFFTKIYIDDDQHAPHAEVVEPFATLLNARTQEEAERWASAQSTPDADEQSLTFDTSVRLTGFEPATFCSGGRRSIH